MFDDFHMCGIDQFVAEFLTHFRQNGRSKLTVKWWFEIISFLCAKKVYDVLCLLHLHTNCTCCLTSGTGTLNNPLTNQGTSPYAVIHYSLMNGHLFNIFQPLRFEQFSSDAYFQLQPYYVHFPQWALFYRSFRIPILSDPCLFNFSIRTYYSSPCF